MDSFNFILKSQKYVGFSIFVQVTDNILNRPEADMEFWKLQ